MFLFHSGAVAKERSRGMLKHQNRTAKAVGLVTLMKLSAIGQILLKVAGFYYVWIQDIHQGALMFLLAFGCWVIKFNTESAFWKLS